MAVTVLVVDDDDQVRSLVTTVLRKLGHETAEAANAWQALAALQKPVDLVILDVRMPYDISGDDLIDTLKSLGRDVPIIVLSGWVDDLDEEQPPFVKAVLAKPVRIEDFVDTVNRVLARLNELPGKTVKPVHVDDRAGDVKHSMADITVARDLLGYEPRVYFDDGLQRAIHWYTQSR